MELVALPAFSDNYIWMLHDGARALVVGPGDATVVQRSLDTRQLELGAILVTHHHADPVGDVDALRPRLRGTTFGPARENIHRRRKAATLGALLTTKRPCCSVATRCFPPAAATCSKAPPRKGTPRCRCWPPCQAARRCAVRTNTRWPACAAHPQSRRETAISRRTAWCEGERAQGRPTLPSTIERERQINPLLRCQERAVAASAGAHGASSNEPVAVFAALREWKNQFR